MNYIKHLTGFFNRIAIENSINPSHISLYIALFQSWNVNRFKNPIIISRDEMMKASKIASKATYHKCIKELQRLKFLEYYPSYNPYSGTQVFMINFSEVNNLKTNDLKTTSSKNTSTKPKNELHNSNVNEQANEPPYIYNKQTLENNKNIYIDSNFQILENEKIEEVMHFAFADTEKTQPEKSQQKSSAKKEKMFTTSTGADESQTEKDLQKFISPSIDLVKEYFKIQNYPEFEAERFFNYYSSIGWLIGGKTKMKDWHSSARNWMLNSTKFSANIPSTSLPKVQSQTRAYNLHATIDKNYAEPL